MLHGTRVTTSPPPSMKFRTTLFAAAGLLAIASLTNASLQQTSELPDANRVEATDIVTSVSLQQTSIIPAANGIRATNFDCTEICHKPLLAYMKQILGEKGGRGKPINIKSYKNWVLTVGPACVIGWFAYCIRMFYSFQAFHLDKRRRLLEARARSERRRSRRTSSESSLPRRRSTWGDE